MIKLVSVTQRIKQVKQPRGGFLKPSEMERIQLPVSSLIEYKENLAPYIVGTTVDYLTRFMLSGDLKSAFWVSYKGARLMNEADQAIEWLEQIKGLDDNSITCASKAVNYDSMYRAGFAPSEFKEPDEATIESIRMLVKRSLEFFKQHGPITKDGFTFHKAYTHLINAGDGDFLTENTMWDFKVSKYPPNKDHTLQLLIYYLMGRESGKPEFQNIRYIAIYNPRLHEIFKYDMTQMDISTIYKIRTDVIGYK